MQVRAISRSKTIRAVLLLLPLALQSFLSIADQRAPRSTSTQVDSIDSIVHDFLIEGLVFFRHDKSTHLFIGDPALVAEAGEHDDDLATVTAHLSTLRQRLLALAPADDALSTQRRRDLQDRLRAFEVRGQILMGNPPSSFDEETFLQFGVTVPHYTEEHFQALAQQLEDLVPGDGPLERRLEAFREQFVIPPERLEAVIGTAMAECRRRTLEHINLPEDEWVSLHIAHNQPWVGFTFYKGNSHSEIHLNADVPVHIERAIELGCHEGYPGHHVHATLLEQQIVAKRGWQEYSLIGLFGPLAVIAEGAASHAIDLVFTAEERLAFERDILLPMAGLKTDRLHDYYRYVALMEALNYARNEVAQKYLFEGMSRKRAIEWLSTFGLETDATAAQRLNFIDALRTYVVTYNYGRELVKSHIRMMAGEDRNSHWQVFQDILLTPKLPADLSNSRH